MEISNNNNNYLTMNKMAMWQEVENNPCMYSSSIEMFNNEEIFIDKFTKFEAAGDKSMANFVNKRYETVFKTMGERLFDASDIKKFASILEIVADYIKNVI